MTLNNTERFELRKMRIRKKIDGTSVRPRISVYRSNRHIYAQVIDDENGRTLAAVSTESADLQEQLKGKKKIEQAKMVGELLAKKAIGAGVLTVVFDRGGHAYHGRIKALGDAARAAGLKF